MSVCAIYVTFNPSLERLARSVLELSRQSVGRFIIVDNASEVDVAAGLRESLSDIPFEILAMPENVGIAAALNRGSEKAREGGASHLLLMDQDSVPAAGMVDALLAAHEVLAKNEKISAVGPALVDAHTGARMPFLGFGWIRMAKYYPHEKEDPVKVDQLMTSGMLLGEKAFQEVGPMREDFFIDCVDTEWCYRAQAVGGACYGVPAAALLHHLGEATIAIGFGFCRLRIQRHRPFRYYYMCRNPWLMARERRIAWRQRCATLIRCAERILFFPALIRGARFAMLRMMLWGVWDGVRGRGGRCGGED